MSLSIAKSDMIDAPLARVWAVLGNFADNSWTGVATSTLAPGKGATEVGAVKTVRVTATGKQFDERLLQYSAGDPHFFTYEATLPADPAESAFPGVASARATFRAEPVTAGDRTFVSYRCLATLADPTVGPAVEAGLGQMLDAMFAALKRVTSAKPRLTYFGLRGRAEIVRLLLEAAHVDYEDDRLTFEQFGPMKPTLPFGQLPLYNDGDVQDLAQTHAIAHHVARKYHLYGATAADGARIDMIVEAFRDVLDAIFKVLGNDLVADPKPLVDAVAPHLERLEKHLGGAKWFAGAGFTLADAAAYFTIANFVLPAAPDALAALPGLQALVRRAAEGPLREYLDSDRRPAIVLPPMVNKLYADPEKCAVKF